MANAVGSKGQVVIEKALRDRLGIQPGWLALQRLVDDHVEISFLPPEYRRSLMGSLAGYTTVRIEPGIAWDETRETAWAKAASIKAGDTEGTAREGQP